MRSQLWQLRSHRNDFFAEKSKVKRFIVSGANLIQKTSTALIFFFSAHKPSTAKFTLLQLLFQRCNRECSQASLAEMSSSTVFPHKLKFVLDEYIYTHFFLSKSCRERHRLVYGKEIRVREPMGQIFIPN